MPVIQLEIENYKSFKDKTVFSMVSSNKQKELLENRFRIEEGFYLLKTASIFGANASGKSNLLSAIGFMQNLIINSFKNSANEDLPSVEFVLNRSTINKPSHLEITYLDDETMVRYGFEVTTENIEKEWLYLDEETIFKREKNSLIDVNRNFISREEEDIKLSITNNRSLFLTILGTTNTPFAEKIIKYFKANINVIDGFNNGTANFTKNLIKNEDQLSKELVKNLEIADFSIKELKYNLIEKDNVPIPLEIAEKLPEEIVENFRARVLSRHNLYDEDGKIAGKVDFDLEDMESSGTISFINIMGPILDTLSKGKTLFIDEIDAQFHPMLTKHILELFHSDNTNIHNAQLIVTSHNSNILDNDFMRRDQIWFVEKNSIESSSISSLSDFKLENGKTVRPDEKYDKNYLKGKYGAIPLIR
ncbi:AAA family ATPase [Lactococcus lactis]